MCNNYFYKPTAIDSLDARISHCSPVAASPCTGQAPIESSSSKHLGVEEKRRGGKLQCSSLAQLEHQIAVKFNADGDVGIIRP